VGGASTREFPERIAAEPRHDAETVAARATVRRNNPPSSDMVQMSPLELEFLTSRSLSLPKQALPDPVVRLVGTPWTIDSLSEWCCRSWGMLLGFSQRRALESAFFLVGKGSVSRPSASAGCAGQRCRRPSGSRSA
jgi:hypothetical protein